MTWTSSFSVSTHAPPAAVWRHWNDRAAWPKWDAAVRSVDAPAHAIAVGDRYTLLPTKGPKARVTTVEKTLLGFVDETRLPLARLRVAHEVTDVDGQTVVTHRVSLHGPAWRLWRWIMGEDVARGLPGAVRGLVARAEADDD